MSSTNCYIFTCIQVSQEVGQVVWYSHLFKNFPQFVVIHTVKGFSVVNEAEVGIFLEFPCFLWSNRRWRFDLWFLLYSLLHSSSSLKLRHCIPLKCLVYPLERASQWLRWQRISLQCGRPGSNPWVGKIPWRRAWLPTPVFLTRESHGQRGLAHYSPWVTKSQTRLSN